MLADAAEMLFALTTLFFGGVIVIVCLCVALGLYFTDKSRKRRLYITGAIGFALFVLVSFVSRAVFIGR